MVYASTTRAAATTSGWGSIALGVVLLVVGYIALVAGIAARRDHVHRSGTRGLAVVNVMLFGGAAALAGIAATATGARDLAGNAMGIGAGTVLAFVVGSALLAVKRLLRS